MSIRAHYKHEPLLWRIYEYTVCSPFESTVRYFPKRTYTDSTFIRITHHIQIGIMRPSMFLGSSQFLSPEVSRLLILLLLRLLSHRHRLFAGTDRLLVTPFHSFLLYIHISEYCFCIRSTLIPLEGALSMGGTQAHIEPYD